MIRSVGGCCEVAKSCTTLCDPMNCNTPGFPSLKERLPCPSLSPWVCANSCPLSQWCHPTISSLATCFSSCPQSFPASGSFPVSQFLASGSQNVQLHHQSFQWILRVISFKIDWFGLLSVQGTFESLLQHHSSKTSILWHSAFFTVQLSCSYMPTRKTIALTIQTFVGKVISLLFNMLSRSVLAFLSLETNLY